jgi:prenyltransferase beta subunit
MKFWEKSLKIIYKMFFRQKLKTLKEGSIEKILKKAISVLDPEIVDEIKLFVRKQQAKDGGFTDRAGKSDLYYSLFGAFLAQALDMRESSQKLVEYLRANLPKADLSGVYLHCATILSVKFPESGIETSVLRRKIKKNLRLSEETGYSLFMSLLSFWYLEDYLSIYKLVKKLSSLSKNEAKPCPVIAAEIVLQQALNRSSEEQIRQIATFYCPNGGFKATKAIKNADLLSTAVALYALHFVHTDIRTIKPDCQNFVSDLFEEGGFKSCNQDYLCDTEYTFYGLLALGSLEN